MKEKEPLKVFPSTPDRLTKETLHSQQSKALITGEMI